MLAVTETYLGRIVDAHRTAVGCDTRRLDLLIDEAMDRPATRPFRGALEAAEEIGVIAEIKRRSPSRGDLCPDLDAAALAVSYQAGGASCLSVLTDAEWFGGSVEDLQGARTATTLPTLRKDFTVDARDVVDARLMGADCVLLIAAALDDAELLDFHALAIHLGLDALVEIHDEAELDRAMAIAANLIGVNQRDLITFEVDQDRAVRLASRIPAGVVRVAESGIRGRQDITALVVAGYHGVLVGESLVIAGEPAEAVRELRGR
jgi:indole-3-glycerol phosphate synthase